MVPEDTIASTNGSHRETDFDGGLLRPSEVAQRLAVSRSWLYDAAREGRIPSLRLGGCDGPLRFVEADLVEWIERARSEWRLADTSRATLQRAASRRAA